MGLDSDEVASDEEGSLYPALLESVEYRVRTLAVLTASEDQRHPFAVGRSADDSTVIVGERRL